jgi:hypothetical protein
MYKSGDSAPSRQARRPARPAPRAAVLVWCAAFILLAPAGAAAATLTYDVVVVGAGTGGVTAAIQAARLGARVALLEETDWVGGQLTASGVSTLDGSAAIRHSGLYREFLERILAFYASREKSVGTCYWNPSNICVNPSIARAVLMDMLGDTAARVLPNGARAVLDLHLGTSVTSVIRSGDVVSGVGAADGRTFLASVVVDATEYGDLLPLSGARYRVGNRTSDDPSGTACVQDITYAAVIRKYPRGTPPDLQVRAAPPGYDELRPFFERLVARDGSSWFEVDADGHQKMVFPVNLAFHNGYRGMPDLVNPENYTAAGPEELSKITKTGVNWANDYPGGRGGRWGWRLPITFLESREARAAFACEAKLLTLNFIHHIQTALGRADWSLANDEGFDTPFNRANHCPNIPDGYQALEPHFPLRPYVRESRRLVGLRTLTARDIQRPTTQARPAPIASAVAVTDHTIDLHNCQTNETLETALETRADIAGEFEGFAQVPFEAFVPETVDGFLVAEKNLSQSRLASGATRLQPATMLTGQAAGVIAALAVGRGVAPRALKPFWVQDALAAGGAVIATHVFGDVPPAHPFFPHTQVAAARGLVEAADPTTFGVNDPGTRRVMARAIVKAFDLSLPDPPATPTFADVPAADPDFPYIEALSRAGVTGGCATAPPRFCPDDPLTRGQMSVFLIRALGFDAGSAPRDPFFHDVVPAAFYFAHVQLMRQHGITFGCAPDAFCPDAGVTRGQIAVFVVRAMRLVP